MAKKDEFDLELDFEKELGFNNTDLLNDDAQMDALDLKETPDTENSVYSSISDDEELDFLDDEFLASLGIIVDDDDEEDLPEAKAQPKQSEESEAPEAFADTEEPEVFAETEETAEDSQDEEDIVDDLEEDFEDDYDEILDEEDESGEDYGFDMDDSEEAQEDEIDLISVPKPAFDVDSTPDLGEDFAATYDEVAKEQESVSEETAETAAKKAELSDIPKRRRKMSKERIIKEVYLPPIIAGLALILILCFVGGAIGRGIKANKDADEALKASNEASVSALQQEANTLVSQAYVLASGYDYDAALNVLNSFSGEKTE